MNKTLLLVALSCLLISGCASVESRWDATQRQNSISAYQAFLDEYPNSQFASSARAKIAEQEAKIIAEQEAKIVAEQKKKKEIAEQRSLLMEKTKKMFDSWRQTDDHKVGEQLTRITFELDPTAEEMTNLFGPPDNIEKRGTHIFWYWIKVTSPGQYEQFGYRAD